MGGLSATKKKLSKLNSKGGKVLKSMYYSRSKSKHNLNDTTFSTIPSTIVLNHSDHPASPGGALFPEIDLAEALDEVSAILADPSHPLAGIGAEEELKEIQVVLTLLDGNRSRSAAAANANAAGSNNIAGNNATSTGGGAAYADDEGVELIRVKSEMPVELETPNETENETTQQIGLDIGIGHQYPNRSGLSGLSTINEADSAASMTGTSTACSSRMSQRSTRSFQKGVTVLVEPASRFQDMEQLDHDDLQELEPEEEGETKQDEETETKNKKNHNDGTATGKSTSYSAKGLLAAIDEEKPVEAELLNYSDLILDDDNTPKTANGSRNNSKSGLLDLKGLTLLDFHILGSRKSSSRRSKSKSKRSKSSRRSKTFSHSTIDTRDMRSVAPEGLGFDDDDTAVNEPPPFSPPPPSPPRIKQDKMLLFNAAPEQGEGVEVTTVKSVAAEAIAAAEAAAAIVTAEATATAIEQERHHQKVGAAAVAASAAAAAGASVELQRHILAGVGVSPSLEENMEHGNVEILLKPSDGADEVEEEGADGSSLPRSRSRGLQVAVVEPHTISMIEPVSCSTYDKSRNQPPASVPTPGTDMSGSDVPTSPAIDKADIVLLNSTLSFGPGVEIATAATVTTAVDKYADEKACDDRAFELERNIQEALLKDPAKALEAALLATRRRTKSKSSTKRATVDNVNAHGGRFQAEAHSPTSKTKNVTDRDLDDTVNTTQDDSLSIEGEPPSLGRSFANFVRGVMHERQCADHFFIGKNKNSAPETKESSTPATESKLAETSFEEPRPVDPFGWDGTWHAFEKKEWDPFKDETNRLLNPSEAAAKAAARAAASHYAKSVGLDPPEEDDSGIFPPSASPAVAATIPSVEVESAPGLPVEATPEIPVEGTPAGTEGETDEMPSFRSRIAAGAAMAFDKAFTQCSDNADNGFAQCSSFPVTMVKVHVRSSRKKGDRETRGTIPTSSDAELKPSNPIAEEDTKDGSQKPKEMQSEVNATDAVIDTEENGYLSDDNEDGASMNSASTSSSSSCFDDLNETYESDDDLSAVPEDEESVEEENGYNPSDLDVWTSFKEMSNGEGFPLVFHQLRDTGSDKEMVRMTIKEEEGQALLVWTADHTPFLSSALPNQYVLPFRDVTSVRSESETNNGVAAASSYSCFFTISAKSGTYVFEAMTPIERRRITNVLKTSATFLMKCDGAQPSPTRSVKSSPTISLSSEGSHESELSKIISGIADTLELD